MPLSPGARLGPYEIEAAIGHGGMGEVYKASDSRLGRTVAIKVISPKLTGDVRFVERFDREARLLSALQHPSICALYDIGQQDGVRYVVMEYLAGPTLADWIETDRKAIPPFRLTERVLSMAIEIAEALDHAHARGIVHRDLKPGNVLITSEGLKVVDFGLATQMTSGDQAVTHVSMTRDDAIVGTLPYMAPELLDGHDADARSDVWAFGCVLYEMFTGRRTFEGSTVSRLIASIAAAEVSFPSGVDSDKAAPFEHFLRRCLAHAPQDRWASGHDLAVELRWIAGLVLSPAPSPLKRRWPAAVAGAALVGTLALAAGLWIQRPPVAATSLSRLSVLLPQTAPFNIGGLPNAFAISPDGAVIAHLVWRDGRAQELHLRRIDAFDSAPIPGSIGAVAPFFSPDGRWVGFLVDRQIKKAPVVGGPAILVGPTGDSPSQPSWSNDNRIIFSDVNGVSALAATGGRPELLIPIDRSQDEAAFSAPTLLPHGRMIFAVRGRSVGWNTAKIVAHHLDSGQRTIVVEEGYAPKFVDGRYLVFSRAATLLAVHLDPATLRVLSGPVPVLDRPINNFTFGWSQTSISSSGALVYVEAAPRVPARVVWVDRNGRVEPAASELKVFEHPRISPDGERFVVGVREESIDVWLGRSRDRTVERFTFDPTEDESPLWHPDGRQVSFAANRGGRRVTLLKPLDGSDERTIGEHGAWHHHLGAWSPDGSALSMTMTESSGTAWNLFLLRPGTSRSMVPDKAQAFTAQASAFSPDGKWLAYASDESGRAEIYVDAAPEFGKKRQVTVDGGTEPLWSRDGKELFFRRGDQMMIANVSATPSLSIGRPRLLFDGHFEQIDWGERNYDVAPAGDRFLMIRSDTARIGAELRIVLNWIQELRAKLGS